VMRARFIGGVMVEGRVATPSAASRFRPAR
jgi:hypothetical protein